MQSTLLDALRMRQPEIRACWTELLRVEPVNTPLAHPEALAHLIDWTITEIFRSLATGGHVRRLVRDHTGTPHRSRCPCGRNPLLSYFDAASQALWAAAHGITSLLIVRPTFAWVDREQLIGQVVDAAIDALLA